MSAVGWMTGQDGEEITPSFHFDPCPHVLISIVPLGECSPEAVAIAHWELRLEENTGPQIAYVPSLVRQIKVSRTEGSFFAWHRHLLLNVDIICSGERV